MANLRDVRLRMRAIEQTLQVTKAMNLISTAKLRKGRRMLDDTKPYFQRIQKSMADILFGTENIDSVYFRNQGQSATRTAVIVITSDKGLAGGYNANIAKQVNELCERINNPMLILIGAVGYRYFVHSPYVILENFTFHSKVPTLINAAEITDYMISQYLYGVFNEIHVVYTHMFSTVKLQPVEQLILPLSANKVKGEMTEIDENERKKIAFEFLPSKEKVFDTLVPLYVKGLLYGAMVEAHASEQSARMTAMDEASKSAEEMLATLRVSYNRARQAGITQEISEIIGGTAVLAGN